MIPFINKLMVCFSSVSILLFCDVLYKLQYLEVLQGFTWEILTLYEELFCAAGNSSLKGQRWVITIASDLNSCDYKTAVNDGAKIFCNVCNKENLCFNGEF